MIYLVIGRIFRIPIGISSACAVIGSHEVIATGINVGEDEEEGHHQDEQDGETISFHSS